MFAVTRDSSNVVRLFLDGGLEDSGTWTINMGTTSLRIASKLDSTKPYQGYLDEVRITKGVARYTSNFTPQTSEFYKTYSPGLVNGTTKHC